MRIPARADACCGSHRGWHLKLALLLSFCLALASSASSLPQTQSRTEASATVSKARALLQQGNTEQVINLLSHYLQAHSKDSSARDCIVIRKRRTRLSACRCRRARKME